MSHTFLGSSKVPGECPHPEVRVIQITVGGRVGDDTSRIEHINADMLPRWESSMSDRCHLFNVALLLSMTPFATAQRKATANPPSSRAG